MANKLQAKDLEGIFVYHDEKGITYYSLPNSNKGYVIDNKEANAFYLYQLRTVICVALALILIFFFDFPVLYTLLICFGIYAITTAIFFKAFLKKLVVVDNFVKPHRKSYITEQAETCSYEKLIEVPVVALLLTFAISYGVVTIKLSGSSLVLSLLVTVGYGIYAILQLIALIVKIINSRKKKE